MGAVYLAEHVLLGRKAAIKVLRRELSERPELVQRFFNEARAATAIADPGIVQVFDFGHHVDGSSYLVMELLEGETLDGRLRRLGRLSIGSALRFARQVATSLAAAHGCGIVHRDLKPDNIFLVRDAEVQGGERAKVLDFGIATLAGDLDADGGQPTLVMGTPPYMSPEQCLGTATIDHRSDIYSLGCLLYHTVVGQPPFDSTDDNEVLVMHLSRLPPAPSSMAGEVPPIVDALVAQCLAKSPDHRFQSASDLAAALERALDAGFASERADTERQFDEPWAEDDPWSEDLPTIPSARRRRPVRDGGG